MDSPMQSPSVKEFDVAAAKGVDQPTGTVLSVQYVANDLSVHATPEAMAEHNKATRGAMVGDPRGESGNNAYKEALENTLERNTFMGRMRGSK